MPLTLHGANLHLDVVYGAATPPATYYVAAVLEEPTYTGDGDDLEEPSDAAYERVEVTNDTTNWADSALGTKVNALEILFDAATETWGTVRYWAICDASTSGDVIAWGTTTAALVTSGDELRFPPSQLSIEAA